MIDWSLSDLKCAGIGLRTEHLDALMVDPDQVPWIELLADNWLAQGGLTKAHLEKLAYQFPIGVHGVGLSLFGQTPVDYTYLEQIKALLHTTQAVTYSEHLSFSESESGFIPDLLPIIYNERTLSHCSQRIEQVQTFLGRQILIENVSSYLGYNEDSMEESEFLKQLSKQSGCGLLLDINNLFVNQVNLNRCASSAIHNLMHCDVQQYHLGGHEDKGAYLVDTHNQKVSDAVWQLYDQALTVIGPKATIIEWDSDIPSFELLNQERTTAQGRIDHALA